MANSKYEMREIRFIIEPELTQCYVHIVDDGTFHLIRGWHHKTFPASEPVIDILQHDITDAVMWPLEAPPA